MLSWERTVFSSFFFFFFWFFFLAAPQHLEVLGSGMGSGLGAAGDTLGPLTHFSGPEMEPTPLQQPEQL